MNGRSLLFWLLIFVLVAASAYGFYYYRGVFAETSPWLWLFVPDSALAIVFALLVVVGARKGAWDNLLRYFASVSLVKYGVWTVFVMMYHPQAYLAGGRALESVFLYIIPHIGMVLLALAVLPKRRSAPALALCALFFLLNDYFDYFFAGGIVAGIIPNGNFGVVAGVSILLTFFSLLFAHFASSWKKLPKIEVF
ncbi:hypothetical protein AUJ17_04055 [Candidatus Micrarchaeota archaeon CG1_02_47_40]|nr:MAG: hypothetical protein AUJ17_04055 [Candidatus Micrarchaeota archaeon CG1_02_47_40]QBM01409.1 hypothetical protein [uncultured archaeon]